MKTMFQTTSRAALIALMAAAPITAAYAQSATDSATSETQVLPEGGSAEASATAEATAADETATDEVATDDAATMDKANEDIASDSTMPAEDATGAATGTDMAADSASNPMTPAADPAADPAATTDMAAAEEPTKPVDGQITMQSGDTVLANDLLGATVYNDADENVGDISDFIIGMDGSVQGVVIGVGGFLGLGEKSVAVEMASLEVVTDDAGNPRLVTSATEADLKAAPEFVTAAEQASESEQTDMMNSTGSAAGGTTAPVQ